jgi:pilus assembly protein CpaF
MAGMDLPLSAVREHIAASIDVIVQQSRLSDGRRLITAIVEITGMESGRIQSQTLFRYVRTPVPAFAGCGVAPECFMDEEGAHTLPAALFDRKTPLPREGASSW